MFVCICNSVTDTEIRDAVMEGARDLDAISEQLDVGTCCGKCKSCAKRVIREARAEMAYNAISSAIHMPGPAAEPATA